MINFQNVSKRYNGYEALIDVTFKIVPQEFVSIVGRSGAGKSTVVKLLIGEEKPTSGRVTFGHYDVSKLKSGQLPQLRRHIGTVFQDFKLLPTKNVYENIAFALEVADEPTGNLDPFNTSSIINILTKINELGTTLILATHNKDIVDRLGRRVILLEGGKVASDEEKGRY